MDDRIIDFNEIKNQAREKDVDKLENYMYSLYYDMAQGKLTIADFNKSIMQYIAIWSIISKLFSLHIMSCFINTFR